MEFNFGRSIVAESQSQSQTQQLSQSQVQFSPFPPPLNHQHNISQLMAPPVPASTSPHIQAHTNNGFNHFGSYSRAISSQETNRIPVAISQTSSTTTGSSMPIVEEVQGGLDFNRNQSRFQEFIARSRHMEVMEVLHDVKKRIVTLEEHVAIQHTITMQSIQGLNRESNLNTNTITEGMSKMHTSNMNYWKELSNNINGCKDQVQQLQIELKRKSNFHDKNRVDSGRFPSGYIDEDDDGDDGVPLQEYLAYRKTGMSNTNVGRKGKEVDPILNRLNIQEMDEKKQVEPVLKMREPLLSDDPDFDPLVCTQFDGIGDHEYEYEQEDTYVVDSFMTNPIMYK